MGLQYVVAKRIFGFDKDKNVKYVAKSVGAGELDFDKLCAKVSRKRILFFPGKAFSQMLGNMSVTKMVVPDTDYTDGSSNGGGDNSNPSGGNDGDQGENPLG